MLIDESIYIYLLGRMLLREVLDMAHNKLGN